MFCPSLFFVEECSLFVLEKKEITPDIPRQRNPRIQFQDERSAQLDIIGRWTETQTDLILTFKMKIITRNIICLCHVSICPLQSTKPSKTAKT
jgi:hypothetical protein